mgnify:CR=1 FL=1
MFSTLNLSGRDAGDCSTRTVTEAVASGAVAAPTGDGDPSCDVLDAGRGVLAVLLPRREVEQLQLPVAVAGQRHLLRGQRGDAEHLAGQVRREVATTVPVLDGGLDEDHLAGRHPELARQDQQDHGLRPAC